MTCNHPPIAEVSQLLICRKCHAAKVEGVLKSRVSSSHALCAPGTADRVSYFLDATPVEMLVDPALVGKRVRVTIEVLSDDDVIAAKEVVTGVS